MKKTAAGSESAYPDLELLRSPYWDTIADWARQAFLSAGVLIIGLFAATLGPLFALDCGTCQDGIRGELPVQGVFFAVARYGIPLTAVATAVAVFAPRGSTRAAVTGTGVMALLLLVLMVLGESGV